MYSCDYLRYFELLSYHFFCVVCLFLSMIHESR